MSELGFSDLIIGALHYRKHVNLLSGWVHHSLYILVNELALRRSWAHIFAFCSIMEVRSRLMHRSANYVYIPCLILPEQTAPDIYPCPRHPTSYTSLRPPLRSLIFQHTHCVALVHPRSVLQRKQPSRAAWRESDACSDTGAGVWDAYDVVRAVCEGKREALEEEGR